MSRPPWRIGITVGDPAGIGPEVVAKALALAPDAHYVVYGDTDAVERAARAAPNGARGTGWAAGVETRRFVSHGVSPGQPDPRAAKGTVDAIEAAARACLAGELDAMVTGPISKEICGAAGYTFPGHTELLAEIDGEREPVMMLVGGSLRVALATIHCALREVPERLTVEGIAEVASVIDRDLRQRFAIDAPRIAVCGLNPHAGEAGRFGDEEARIIEPAIARARGAGVDARGPFSADSLFHRAIAGEFDCVLGMYHDQALGPLKTHAFSSSVNVTCGLRLVRTSVDHGTGFDIAGSGRADPGSMVEALRLAQVLVENVRRGEKG